ncbi:MAG: sulfurtransferase/chromate resistance protein [Pseudomonadota bacterium]
MPAPTEITSAQLYRLVGTAHCPAIVDLRIDADFDDDPRVIPSSRRFGFNDIDAMVSEFPDRSVVVYCQKGKKISQGAAALLRARGVKAETLLGGHFAWRDSGYPMIPSGKLTREGKQTGLWVTRHRPKIDRIACPWLIRRFVDPAATFLFVPPADVFDVAERFGAEPFDMDQGFWTHRVDRCTFDTMIEEFNLEFPALKELAVVVRGADINQHDLSPQSAGLLAVSLGMSRMYRDDLEQLDACMPIYDALYRWCRDAMDENHDWPVKERSK